MGMNCTGCKNLLVGISKHGFIQCRSCGKTNLSSGEPVAQHKKSKTKKSGNGSKIKVTKKSSGKKKTSK